MRIRSPSRAAPALDPIGPDSIQAVTTNIGITSNDDVWEDIAEEDEKQPLRSTSSPAGSIRVATPRKRKALHHTSFVAAQPRKPVFSSPTTKRPLKAPRNIITTEEIVDGSIRGISFTFQYLFDVLITAIHLLRKPLYLIVFLWLLAVIIGLISNTVRTAFAPLCYVPGISGSPICRQDISVTPTDKLPKWADYPQLIKIQSTTFEHLLDESGAGSGLSLEIKKAEMATSDLVTLVRASSLKSKGMIADTLVDFVDDAKQTGRSLQKMTSKIAGAVDTIMAVNDYALHSIEAAQSQPSRLSMQGLVPWFTRSAPTKEVLIKTFTDAMSVLSNTMERLILEAQVNIANLDRLEEKLSTLHSLMNREDANISEAKAEVLAALWTWLGGNKRVINGMDHHLTLLKNLSLYRRKALMHVVAAMQTLQALGADMEDLRERVAAPEIVTSSIPVEVHMKSIQSGLQRMKERKEKAKRLEEEAMRRILDAETT